jgi:AsmA protein
MKILKWILLVLLILIFLVIAGVGIAVATLDPNDYKEQITEQVKKTTGRELTLEGDISWSLFPWLGLNLGKTSLANAEGFGDQPFAELEEIDIHVAIMPLIKKQVQAKKVLISGVSVNLQKNADGKDNWSDLAAGGEEEEPVAEEAPDSGGDGAAPDIDIQINGFEVVNARLSYIDKQAGTSLRVDPLNLKTGQIALDTPVPLEAELTLFQDAMTVDAQLSGTLYANLESGDFQFTDLIIEQTVKGEGIPGGSLSGTEKANIKANTNTQRLTIDSLSLDVLGIVLGGHLKVEQFIDGPQFSVSLKSTEFNPVETADQLDITLEGADSEAFAGTSFSLEANGDTKTQLMTVKSLALESPDLQLSSHFDVKQFIDNPQFSGEIKTNAFNPKALMTQLGVEAPVTADEKALTSASVEIGVKGDMKSVHLKPFKATLDESTLSGQVSIIDLAKQALRFDLTLDQLNADRYLPPTSEVTETTETAPVAATPEASDAIELPVEMMRTLNVDGTARIQKFTVSKLDFQDASLTVKANNGLLELAPLSAKAYQGNAKINASLDVRKDVPGYKAQVDLRDVQSGEILQVLFGDRLVSGTANFKTKISTGGGSVTALEKNLNGNFSAKFADGTIKGSKLSQKINEFRNFFRKLKGKPLHNESIDEGTKFSLLAASGNIKNGVVTNKDLKLEAPVFLATGKGSVDLPKKHINYTLSLAEPGKKDKKYFVPLQIKGPFDDLGFKLNLKSFAKLQAQEAVDAEKARLEKKLDAEKAQLKEKAKQEQDKLKNKLEDQLKDKLKGFFK